MATTGASDLRELRTGLSFRASARNLVGRAARKANIVAAFPTARSLASARDDMLSTFCEGSLIGRVAPSRCDGDESSGDAAFRNADFLVCDEKCSGTDGDDRWIALIVRLAREPAPAPPKPREVPAA